MLTLSLSLKNTLLPSLSLPLSRMYVWMYSRMDFVPPDVCLRHRVNLNQATQHDTESEFWVPPRCVAILSLTASHFTRHFTCKDFTKSFASNSSLWSISPGYITCRQWKRTWNWNDLTLYESDESQTATNEVYSITPKRQHFFPHNHCFKFPQW